MFVIDVIDVLIFRASMQHIYFIYLFIFAIFAVYIAYLMLDASYTPLHAEFSAICFARRGFVCLLGFRSQMRRLNKLSASSHADKKNGPALTKHVLLCSATTMFILCFV